MRRVRLKVHNHAHVRRRPRQRRRPRRRIGQLHRRLRRDRLRIPQRRDLVLHDEIADVQGVAHHLSRRASRIGREDLRYRLPDPRRPDRGVPRAAVPSAHDVTGSAPRAAALAGPLARGAAPDPGQLGSCSRHRPAPFPARSRLHTCCASRPDLGGRAIPPGRVTRLSQGPRSRGSSRARTGAEPARFYCSSSRSASAHCRVQ